MSVKCKGCNGTIEYVPIEVIKGTAQYPNAGPAIAHIPATPCNWFMNTRASEILAYINVAEHKLKQGSDG